MNQVKYFRVSYICLLIFLISPISFANGQALPPNALLACTEQSTKAPHADASNIESKDVESKDVESNHSDPFALMKNEAVGDLKIDQSDTEVLQLLKEPERKGESVLWGADGLYHQNWHYPRQGLVINMSAEQDGGPQKIFSVLIMAPSQFKTKRGIGIGSPLTAVKDAYSGEESETFDREADEYLDQTLIFGSVYGGLFFSVKDQAVVSIFLGPGAE